MITVLACLKALPGKETELAEICAQLANEVRTKEEGNLMYIAHITANDPTEIIFVEKYKDEQARINHRNSAHFKKAGCRFKDLLAAPLQIKILNELE